MDQVNIGQFEYIVQEGDYSSFTFTENIENLQPFNCHYSIYESHMDVGSINWNSLHKNENISGSKIDFSLKSGRSNPDEKSASISGNGLDSLENLIKNLQSVRTYLKQGGFDMHRPQIMVIFQFGQGTFVLSMYFQSWEGESLKSFAISYLSKGVPVKTEKIDTVFSGFGLHPPQEANLESTVCERINIKNIPQTKKTNRSGIYPIFSTKNSFSGIESDSRKLNNGFGNTKEMLVEAPTKKQHISHYVLELIETPHLEEGFFYNLRAV